MNDSLLGEPQVFLPSLVGFTGHLVHNVHVPTYHTMHGLKTEHEGVEVVNLLSVQRVVAHVHVVIGVPIKLGHPDGKIELLPQQVHVALNFHHIHHLCPLEV